MLKHTPFQEDPCECQLANSEMQGNHIKEHTKPYCESHDVPDTACLHCVQNSRGGGVGGYALFICM